MLRNMDYLFNSVKLFTKEYCPFNLAEKLAKETNVKKESTKVTKIAFITNKVGLFGRVIGIIFNSINYVFYSFCLSAELLTSANNSYLQPKNFS